MYRSIDPLVTSCRCRRPLPVEPFLTPHSGSTTSSMLRLFYGRMYTVSILLQLFVFVAPAVLGRGEASSAVSEVEVDVGAYQVNSGGTEANGGSNELEECASAIVSLTGGNNVFNEISFDVHRNGENESCGKSSSSLDLFRKTLQDMKLCLRRTLDKYQMESFLTTLLISSLDGGSCGSTDNATAPSGLEGFCDSGSNRTVVLSDHQKLAKVPFSGSLPCRFYTREGVRIESFAHLAKLAQKSKEEPGSREEKAIVDLYSVPAGRMFMFAPSAVGETFVLDHLVDDIGQALVVETLSLQPRVFELNNFFTKEEGADVMDSALAETSETHAMHRSRTGAASKSIYR